MVAHWFQRPAVSAPIARQSQKYISSSQFAVLQFNKESAGISSPTKVLAYTTSTVWGWQQRKKKHVFVGGETFFTNLDVFLYVFFTKMRRRRCRREFIWPFHFYFPDKCTCPPITFFEQNFLFFLSFFSVLLFMALVEPHFRDQKIKTFSFSFSFSFFFLLRFFEPSFFYPAPETIYPLISGGPVRNYRLPDFGAGSENYILSCFFRFFFFRVFPYPSPTPFVFAKYTKAICEDRDDSFHGWIGWTNGQACQKLWKSPNAF